MIIDLAFTVGTAITDSQSILFTGFPKAIYGNIRFRIPKAFTVDAPPLVLAINMNGQIVNQWSQGGVAATVYQGQAVYICAD